MLSVVREIVKINGVADKNIFAIDVFNREAATVIFENQVGTFEGRAGDNAAGELNFVCPVVKSAITSAPSPLA